MKGIGRRVAVGFLSIVFLLFASGMVSFFELKEIAAAMEDVMNVNEQNVRQARVLFELADRQNDAVWNLALLKKADNDTVVRKGMDRLERELLNTVAQTDKKQQIDTILLDVQNMRKITDDFLLEVQLKTIDSVDQGWYVRDYKPSYEQLRGHMNDYMTAVQSTIAPRAKEMQSNAYRAVTPVLISLVFMIAVVLMLYYFMTIYCVQPVVRMNKSLGDSIKFKVPFNVKADCKDEMLELKEKIDMLIATSKSDKNTKL